MVFLVCTAQHGYSTNERRGVLFGVESLKAMDSLRSPRRRPRGDKVGASGALDDGGGEVHDVVSSKAGTPKASRQVVLLKP